MSSKSLSLVLPNYNHGALISKALDAVFAQSRVPEEIIVIDDCSTDNSVNVISGYAEKHSEILFIKNESNRGCMACNNYGRRIARGDYVVGLSADDVPLPGLYERSMRLLEAHPEAAWCSADIELWFGEEPWKIWHKSGWLPQAGFMQASEFAGRLLLGPIHTHTIVARKDLFWKYGGLDVELSYQADWFLYLRMAFEHGVCYIPRPLAVWRMNEDSWSNAGMRVYENQERILDRVLNLLRNENRDAAAMFAASGALRLFAPHIDRYLVNRTADVDDFTFLLCRSAIEENERRRSNPATMSASFYMDCAAKSLERGELGKALVSFAKALEWQADPRSIIAFHEFVVRMLRK